MSIDDSFMSFHLLCDQIQSDSSLTIKKDIIRAFVSRYAGDLGLLFKLLLPKYNGRLYYLQDKQLIKLLAIALGQTETTLKNHLNGSGCIGLTASHFFKPRLPPVGQCQLNEKGICILTLPQFDAYLDALSQASGEAQQLSVLQKFLNVCCRNALFTFLRSVKQDLHLGAGVRVVLEGLHPNANAIFKRCANIQEVVKKVQAGSVDDDDDEIDTLSNQSGQRGISPGATGVKKGFVEASITIFMPLAPMLASPSNGVDHVLQKTPNGAYSETKYDGERIQIHKQGSTFKFFARSLKPMKPDKYEGLEKYLVESVKAHSCILDGEILLVDVATSKPLPFGTLGKHKKMQFATACTCIFLFDIMYKDGKTLLDVPMDERREYLKSSVQFIQNRVMISEMRLVHGTVSERRAIMQKHLQYAVAEGLEGLVIKDIKSLYEPGSRHWIKLKKDYLQGMADSADLIVLGAWYGSGNKGGVLSTFLMGVWDKTNTSGLRQFKTVVKVGNGHDDTTLAKLNSYFKSSGRLIPGGPGVSPPSWIDISTAHYPDVYINPSPHADVWEISAAEFSQTKTHTANGVSMRFPRVTKIRDDKDLNTATSLHELVQLMNVSSVKGSKLDALGAHQQVGSDDEDSVEGSHEKGVMMRTSSRYDGPISVVPGQHFGPLTPAAIAALKNNVQQPTQIAKTEIQNPTSADANRAQQINFFTEGGVDVSHQLKRTPFWVFRTKGFKGETPPPMPFGEPDAPAVGSIEYIQGDITAPRTLGSHPHQNLLLIHCCALGMKWSQRGSMGALSKVIGDEPEEAYTLYMDSGEASIGDALLVECSNKQNKGRLFVATILGQTAVQGGIPQIDQDSFEKALLVHLLPFAKAHLCSVHIPKIERGTGINWGAVDKILRYTYSRHHNLRVVVYQKNAVTAEPIARQDTSALPPRIQIAPENSVVEAAGNESLPIQRLSTAPPLPLSLTSSSHCADSRNSKIKSSNCLSEVRACLFTTEGASGSSSEPMLCMNLRKQLLSLGASILPFCTFTEDEVALISSVATHIILPVSYRPADNPVAAEVLLSLMSDLRAKESKAIVVRGEWVGACVAANARVEPTSYGLSRKLPIEVPMPHSSLPVLPLKGAFIVIIGGSEEDRTNLAMLAQDLGAVVQEKLRMSEGNSSLTEMKIIRTGVTVSVPIKKTTHVLVKPYRKLQTPATDSINEGFGSTLTTPIRTTNTTVFMNTDTDFDSVNKALTLGTNVLLDEWLTVCHQRFHSGLHGCPIDSDFFIDDVCLESNNGKTDEKRLSSSRAGSILGSKRQRESNDESFDIPVSLPPTPLSKFSKGNAVARAPTVVSHPFDTLPAFLVDSSSIVLSIHGYGPDDTGILLSQVRELQDMICGRRVVSVEGNLNQFCVKTTFSNCQRILVCEVLTDLSLPLLKSVSSSCQRALQDPLSYLGEYRSSTVVTSKWLEKCVSSKDIIPVEQFTYRPPVVFCGPILMTNSQPDRRQLPPTPPLRRSPGADDDSTDTASYCTVQENGAQEDETDEE